MSRCTFVGEGIGCKRKLVYGTNGLTFKSGLAQEAKLSISTFCYNVTYYPIQVQSLSLFCIGKLNVYNSHRNIFSGRLHLTAFGRWLVSIKANGALWTKTSGPDESSGDRITTASDLNWKRIQANKSSVRHI